MPCIQGISKGLSHGRHGVGGVDMVGDCCGADHSCTGAMMRIDPQEILAGFQRWPDVQAFTVGPQLYYNKRTARIVAASSFGMAYLLAHPNLIVGARSRDARFWAIQKYGGVYFQQHCDAFCLGFPVESCFGMTGRALEAYQDGLAVRQLLRENGVSFLELETAMTVLARYTPPEEGYLDDAEIVQDDSEDR